MNKVLRDRKTQLKGTDLFCNLLVTCAFRPSGMEPPPPKVAELDTLFTLVSQQESANGGNVPFFFFFPHPAPHHHVVHVSRCR